MDYLSDKEYDKISKNAKNCLGCVKDLADKYQKLTKDHKDFKKLVSDSGLSTLTNMLEFEKKQFRCIKYMKELDEIFIRGSTSALVENGKGNYSDNQVAAITSTTVEPNTSRAKTGIVLCLNEAICADLSASSNAVSSSYSKFGEEMSESFKTGIAKIDELIEVINGYKTDF